MNGSSRHPYGKWSVGILIEVAAYAAVAAIAATVALAAAALR